MYLPDRSQIVYTLRNVIDYNLYSILFTVCEVAFDNFFIKEFYDDDDEHTDKLPR